ncbi:MAG: alpha/beta fold hydrolase [Acidobacteria bacterium]|nr:alpha/beta fold hydrolase [Acidobacteriota bacterium]
MRPLSRISISEGRAALLFAAALTTSAAASSAPARATVELDLENIHRANFGAQAAALSPDGRRAAVTASEPNRRGIWLASTEGGSSNFWVQGSSPAWHPDGTAIVFRRNNDLWRMDMGADAPRRLTNDEHDERAAVVSPDGSQVAFYSTRSGHQDIWTVSSSGGPAVQLTTAAMSIDDPRFSPGWSPDSRSIAYVSNAADYWHDDVWIVDVASGESSQISTGLMASSTPAWSPDGRRIALLGTAKDEYWYEDLAYIYLLDPSVGTEQVVPMQIWATDWLHNHGVHWTDGGRRLAFLYHERGDLNVWSVAAEGGVATRVSHIGGAVRSFDVAANGARAVLVRSVPTRGYDVDLVDLRGGEPRRLTEFATTWNSLQDPVEVAYASFDGMYIQGFLYKPPFYDAGGSFPALVNVHGGGTNSYLRRDNLIEQYLASKGYLVLAVNYRGGSGFGRDFQDLAINDWANRQALDAAAAADFIRALPESNGKVGIYGYSYGGITSMAAIARAPEAFDAAVPMAGIYDFADAYSTADRLGRIFIKTGHGGSPEERPEIYAISDTVARLDNVLTPLLMMHGEADVRAPFRQYELALSRLGAVGIDVTAHSYPDEPHGFRDPANRIDMYTRLERFFDRHLR